MPLDPLAAIARSVPDKPAVIDDRPAGAVSLLDSPSRATGWALFSNPGVDLAVARGSGEAVAQLGAVARQAGIPASLHGTGGAWLIAGSSCDDAWFAAAVEHSLDRKVCNTLNVACVLRADAPRLVPLFLSALQAAADRRGVPAKLHVAEGSEWVVPSDWFDRKVPVRRAGGDVMDEAARAVAQLACLGRGEVAGLGRRQLVEPLQLLGA